MPPGSDAKTGMVHWTCDLLAHCWGSPLIVEDNVFIGGEDGDVAIFKLSADCTESTILNAVLEQDGTLEILQEPLHEVQMLNSVYTTPIVANDVLYIANRTHLFAIAATEQK